MSRRLRSLSFLATLAAAGLASAAYVQDGLVAHFNAIENAGVGVNDPTATTWKNLCGTSVVGDLPLAPLAGSAWRGTYLELTAGTQAAKIDTGRLFTPNSVKLTNLTFEVTAYMPNGKIRRWEVYPWNSSFESWTSDSEGYLERIVETRIAAQKTLQKNKVVYFGSTYNVTTKQHVAYEHHDGTLSKNNKASGSVYNLNGRLSFCSDMAAGGRIYAIRVYDRVLSEAEIRTNLAEDLARIEPMTLTWTGAVSSDPTDAGNWTCGGTAAIRLPAAGDTLVIPAGTSRAPSFTSAAGPFASLQLATGAAFSVAEGVRVTTQALSLGGVAQRRDIYLSAASAQGAALAGLSGAGCVSVAGAVDAQCPTTRGVPDGEGWVTVGKLKSQGGKVGTSPKHWIVGEHLDFTTTAFPPDTKLRVQGYVLWETVPAGCFAAYDTTGLEYVMMHGTEAYADGTALAVPSAAIFRYQPLAWSYDGVTNWLTQGSSDLAKVMSEWAYRGPLEMNGKLEISGDGSQMPYQCYTNRLSGSGKIGLTNFSKQGRFMGPFEMNAAEVKLETHGLLVWFDSLEMNGRVENFYLNNCGQDKHATNASYCATGVAFGRDGSGSAATHPLEIGTLTAYAREITDTKGKRWRRGGTAFVWGGNTIHAQRLYDGLHIVSRRQDQHCNMGWMGALNGVGGGNLVADEFSYGTLYPSTNINITIGKVTQNSAKFDYTFVTTGVNSSTLDITNSCNAASTLKAVDLALLPARLSGFTGSVTLTDASAKAYTIPVDFTKGPTGLYQTVGCNGSGTLAAAPSSGSINVTFPADVVPVKGAYALARFTSGGEKLANWTVTLNGQAIDSVMVGDGYVVKVVKDSTGLWLKAAIPGLTIFLR